MAPRAGTGDEVHDEHDQITLPADIMAQSLEDMINFVYPRTQPGDAALMEDPLYMSDRCCLTPLNENSHAINDMILSHLQGPVHTYFSTIRVVTDHPEEAAAYAIEFLNAQTPGGLPKHKLELKVGPSPISPNYLNSHFCSKVSLFQIFSCEQIDTCLLIFIIVV